MQVALRKLLCTSCFKKCKLHLATTARGPGRNRTRDPPVPGAGARTMRQLPRTSSNNLEFLHLARADSRRGLREHRRNRKKPRVFHLDHADPRRGSRGNFRNRKKTWVFAPRPRRSPQRSRGNFRNCKKPWVFAPRPRRSPQRVDFRVVSSALPRRPKKRF